MSTTPNGPPNLNPRQPVDIARILLVIAILTALTVGSLYILRPFLPGLIWATTIVVATWPLMVAVQRRCGNRRWAATTVMLLVLLIVIVLPLYQAISTLALHGAEIMSAIKSLPTYALPRRRVGFTTCRSPVSASRPNGRRFPTPAPAACSPASNRM